MASCGDEGEVPALNEAMLASLPLFEGCSKGQLATLLRVASLTPVATGQCVLDEGKPANLLRVVVTGKFRLGLAPPGKRELTLTTLGRGELVGWSALLPGRTWLATVTALRPSRVIEFDGDVLRELCERDHDLGLRVMRNAFLTVATRLHDTRLQLLDMYGHG